MAFTFDVTTTRGKVRLLIADTDTSDATKQIFTDAEIDAFLSIEANDVYQSAAAACQSLAASTARSAVIYRASRLLEIERQKVPGEYRALATQYRERAMSEPSEQIDSMAYDIDPFGGDQSEYVGDIV